jgi:hypothetical protein
MTFIGEHAAASRRARIHPRQTGPAARVLEHVQQVLAIRHRTAPDLCLDKVLAH